MHLAAMYRYSARQNAMSQGESVEGNEHGRRSRRRQHTAAASDVPEALPCHRFDGLFPSDADVWGNIVVTDETELRRWVKFCMPTSREDVEARGGGCVIYRPPAAAQEAREGPQYFTMTAPDDTLYGRAAYLSHGGGSVGAGKESSSTAVGA